MCLQFSALVHVRVALLVLLRDDFKWLIIATCVSIMVRIVK